MGFKEILKCSLLCFFSWLDSIRNGSEVIIEIVQNYSGLYERYLGK